MGNLQRKLPKQPLHAWSQETDFSYNTFEMIQIESERGGWFHQFSGLSLHLWCGIIHTISRVT